MDFLGGGVYPCFFEQTSYEIIIERSEKSSKNLAFYHENSNLRDAVTPTGKQGRVLSGMINFTDEVGFTRFEIMGDGNSLLTVELEIFPSKLDYQKDFWQLLSQVNDEVYNLAFDFLKKTYFSAALKSEVKPTQTEFFLIISQIYDNFFKALKRITRQPHYKIDVSERIVKPEKVKKVNGKTVQWLAQRRHLFQQSPKGNVPRKVLDRNKQLTYDTFENRFLKWIILQIIKRLKNFKANYLRSSNKVVDNQVCNNIDLMLRELKQYCHNSFLREVGVLPKLESSSLVMQMAPGYRDVFKYYLMLLKGLNIKSDLFKLSIKGLAELYEYWCFLKLNVLLRNKYNLISNDMVKVDRSGITVNLIKGKKSELTYQNPVNKEVFKIAYNPSFINLPTITQKPDNMLTLEKKGSSLSYRYVFDAKYRIAADPRYLERYHKAGPPEDTINAMHRYRDALVSRAKMNQSFERSVFGAFILFPHNDELTYAGRNNNLPHKFYESIKKISIGAIPFLPSQTILMEEFLEELITESPDTAFERTVIQEGSQSYFTDETYKKNVLIGPLGRREQLDVCLGQSFYYTYLKEVQSYLGELEYVCIYQSKEKFRNKEEQGIYYYGQISGFKIMKRKELKEMPARSRHDELVVKFIITEWHRKEFGIKPGGYGPASPQRTSWQLFQEAQVYPELHLKNRAEIRLWRELKRLDDDVKVNFPKNKISKRDSVESIQITDMVAEKVGDYNFIVKVKDNEKEFSFNRLNQRPGNVIKEIIKLLKI
ncbi:hypothetical protein GGQ84_002636 [Desulfitispora alkaliphila]|uniref:DUF2357 domain-containing protein n=1 Tax=Desulfitispora alkaliphila TaxID=622674 RepID=UPI003D19CD10